MIMPPECIVGSRVTLIKIREADAPRLFFLIEKNRESLAPWLDWVADIRCLEDEQAFTVSSMDKWRRCEAFVFTVNHNDLIIGTATIFNIDRVHSSAELGYWLDEDARNKGIATEIIGILEENITIDKLLLTVNKNNIPSMKLATKLGYTACEKGVKQGDDCIFIKNLILPDNGRFLAQ